MDLWEAIEGRRSVRHFAEEPVTEADLQQIIEAAGLAPSGGNQQPWRFIAVRNKVLLESMRQAVLKKVDEMVAWEGSEKFLPRLRAIKGYSQFFADAPVAIAALTEPYRNPIDRDMLPARGLSFEEIHRLRGDPATQSFGAAVMALCLAAHALGYGTCWMTGPLYAGVELEGLLGVKEPWRLGAIIALGVPAEQPSARPRKALSEILTVID